MSAARRALLVDVAAEHTRRAQLCHDRIAQIGASQPETVADYTTRADAHDWLAEQLTRLLATGAEHAGEDTRHALPEAGEVDEESEGDAVTSARSCSECGIGPSNDCCAVARRLDRLAKERAGRERDLDGVSS